MRVKMSLTRRWLPALLLFAGLGNCYADVLRTEANSKGKVGMVNEAGTVVIPIEFDMVEPWGQLYRVEKSGKYGLYSASGSVVLPVQYSQITDLNCYGRALVCEGGKAKKDQSDKEGRSAISGGKFGLLNEDGKLLIPCQYKGLFEFSYDASSAVFYHEGMRVGYSDHYLGDTLRTDCRYMAFTKTQQSTYDHGIVDGETGAEVLPMGRYTFTFLPQNGMARYYILKKSSCSFGYWNLTSGTGFEVGSEPKTNLNDVKYWTHGDFSGNIAPVNGSGAWKFIDKSGSTVREGYSTIAHSAATHMWVAKRSDGTMEVFDENSNLMDIFNGYKDVKLPNNVPYGVAYPVQNGEDKWGFIDAEGRVLTQFKYDDVSLAKPNVYIGVKSGDKWGLLSQQGQEVVPCRYASVWFPVEENPAYVWGQKSDKLWYRVNVANQTEGRVGYEAVNAFTNGMAWVRPKGITVKPSVLNCALLGCTAEDFSKNNDAWGIIVDEQERTLFPEPVCVGRQQDVKAVIREKGRAMTRSEAHGLLLKLTSPVRRYPITTNISEDDWDY